MSKPTIENSTGPLLHTVFFWLKNPENDSDRKTFETAIRKLIQVKSLFRVIFVRKALAIKQIF